MNLLVSLKRKYGPLPLWAWAAIVGGALALVWRMRSGGQPVLAGDGDTIGEPAIAYGAEPDYGDTGGVGPVAPAPLFTAQDGDELEVVAGRVAQLEDLFALQPWLDVPADPGVEGGSVTTVDPSSTTAAAAAAPKPKGVEWGGRTFTTKQGLAGWLRSRGASYATWAKRHPAAAKLLKGPAPRVEPKPTPKPPAQPSSRTASRSAPARGQGTAGARPRTPPKPAPKVARPRAAPKPAPKPKPKPKKKVRPSLPRGTGR